MDLIKFNRVWQNIWLGPTQSNLIKFGRVDLIEIQLEFSHADPK